MVFLGVNMPQPDDINQKVRELEERIFILQLENDQLTDRAEDTLLLGVIAEQISTSKEIGQVLECGLERISVLKDIPLCAYCSRNGNKAIIVKSYLSFTDEDISKRTVVLPETIMRKLAAGDCLLSSDECRKTGFSIDLKAGSFVPLSVSFIHFKSRYTGANIFLFADDKSKDRLPGAVDLLHRVTEMIVAKMENIFLFQEIQRLNRELDRKVMERTVKLQESENRFRQFFENEPAYCYMISMDGRVLDVNSAALKVLSYKKEELVGKPVQTIYAPESLPKIRENLERWKATEKLSDVELVILSKKGEKRTVLLSSDIVSEVDGKPLHSISVQQDITERKQMEEALAAQEREFRTLAENSPDNIARYDVNCRTVYVNPALEKTLGCPASEMLGMTPEETALTDKSRKYQERIAEVLETGKDTEMDFILPDRGEGVRYNNIRFVAERGTDGVITGVQTIGRDVTERVQTEAEIRLLNQDLEQRVADRTTKLEQANKELEAFAYSVSHDLRAPLRHIDGFIELLQKKTETALDEQSRHYMATISDAANKMGLLIDDLLSFSRMGRQAMSSKQVDLGALVRDVIRELEPDTAERNIEWRIGDLPVVSGDTAMLRLVLVNLIANALKFTQPRQQARIEIGSLSDQDAETVIFVRDDGVGFDMSYADKLFGVFQRLHSADEFEGTGIGLANVRRIIARHGGRTWAKGKVDKGATFYCSLPYQNDTSRV